MTKTKPNSATPAETTDLSKSTSTERKKVAKPTPLRVIIGVFGIGTVHATELLKKLDEPTKNLIVEIYSDDKPHTAARIRQAVHAATTADETTKTPATE